jgi:hypothetical protein
LIAIGTNRPVGLAAFYLTESHGRKTDTQESLAANDKERYRPRFLQKESSYDSALFRSKQIIDSNGNRK